MSNKLNVPVCSVDSVTGDKTWTIDGGILHRLDGPAEIRANGSQAWYQDGELHRVDGPAVIRPGGSEEWCQDGELHRVDGPAVICDNGERWYKNGLLHRLDGPARISIDYKEWYHTGKCHRIDGPAKIYSDGTQEWWLFGVPVHKDIHRKFDKFLSNPAADGELPYEILRTLFDEFMREKYE